MRYYKPLDESDPNASYTNGNASLGQKGSIPDVRALEHPMREILHVITSAGLTPSEEDLTQLRGAVVAMTVASAEVMPDATVTTKGKIELATGTEALGGTDDARAITSAAWASTQNRAASGYCKFPGGMIFQWGAASTTAGSGVWVFPIAFPNGCLRVASLQGAGNPNYVAGATVTASLTQANLSSTLTSGTDQFGCYAIGF